MNIASKNKQYFEFLIKRPIEYFLSTLIIIVATFLQVQIQNLTNPAPFLMYYPAIILAALYGDGISAIFLSVFCIDYYFMGPGVLFDYSWPGDFILIGVYLLFALLIRHLTHKLALSNFRARALVANLESEKNLREQFVASLSHDLRNPISAANVSAKLFMKHPDKVDINKIMNRIIAATERADKMIRDLLDANAIKAGEKLLLPMEHCDLLELAREVVEEKSLKLENPDQLKLKAMHPVQGVWNAEALRRVLENLIDNAIKYGEPSKPVTVNLLSDNGKVEILIHNHGDPLSDEEKNKIFEAFGRADFARTSGKQGWGLGLTLVRGLAEAHSGICSVESNIDGTTFIVCLPLDSRVQKEK